MKKDFKLLIYIVLIVIFIKITLAITGISNCYYDFLLPIIPFIALINNLNIVLILYLFIGLLSSIIHYDEMFSILLGYGVSLMILLNFSKKYSLTNLFNYLLSVFAVSLIVVIIQMLSYFAKDKLIVIRDLFQFLFSNILISLFYYYMFKIVVTLRNTDSVKR